MALLFSTAEPFVQFWKSTLEGTFTWKCFEFGLVVQEEMLLTVFFPFFSCGCHFVQRGRTVCAILVEGIIRIFVWNFEFGPVIRCHEKIFFSFSSGGYFVYQSRQSVQIWHYGEHLWEIIQNLYQWIRRCHLTLYRILTAFNTFANRADPDQAAAWSGSTLFAYWNMIR